MNTNNSLTKDQLTALEKYTKTKEYLLKRGKGFKNLRINNFSVILDSTKYIETHFMAIENSKPLSRVFVVHYLRLYELRQFFLKADQDAKQSK